MKRTIWTLTFVFGLAFTTFAQNDDRWSLGVGITPQFDGFTSGLYINKHISSRWHLGLMPIYSFANYSNSQVTIISV